MNAKKTAPLTAFHATGRSTVDVGEKNGGRHVGLDFYDLLIEALLIESGWVSRCDVPPHFRIDLIWLMHRSRVLGRHGESRFSDERSERNQCGRILIWDLNS
jgi:hypothetical protein